VIGVTSGIFSSEFNDARFLRQRLVSGCERSANTISTFMRVHTKESEGLSTLPERIRRHRFNLHLALETFHSHLVRF